MIVLLYSPSYIEKIKLLTLVGIIAKLKNGELFDVLQLKERGRTGTYFSENEVKN